MKKVLLAPVDPVHDIALKMINRTLKEAGHETILLPPDLPSEQIIKTAINERVDVVFLSRTLGYGVAELLARFADMADAAGLKAKIAIGGMAIRPQMAQELGFAAGFGPGTTMEETLAFVEDRPYIKDLSVQQKKRKDITGGHSYEYKNKRIEALLDKIATQAIAWANSHTSPAVKRAAAREELWNADKWRAYEDMSVFTNEYAALCGDGVRAFYEKGELHPKTRRFTKSDVEDLEKYLRRTKKHMQPITIQHTLKKPVIFNQYGTGCPYMDITHIKVSEGWGADGVVHFDPSWGARTEGLYDGFITHKEDGTVITPANLNRIYSSLEPGTLWQVRAHRGLNTPETVVLAAKIGAHLTKINICYGSLGAGTDPARMTVDGVSSIKYAAKYGLPFDVVTNEELCGVPAFKAFAGMLAVSHIGKLLGARPVLQPLFCYSPEVMIGGQMADNYVDFNTAKILALREIIDAPIWPGAPIGFLTQTEDRVQSSTSTALHSGLAAMLGVDAISIASADEAYSGGPITVPSKVDTLRSTAEAFRFFGNSKLEISKNAELWTDQLVEQIEGVLQEAVNTGDFVEALNKGVFGNTEDGAYPGRAGRGTVERL
ncbi:cobalamin-dependent protein [Clostridiaceae bacterium OttesenSCG-928-D20]|nr:cobalamin-dependent protein [Clostridiaceae bacterium OttesenSCG-928-D20]